MKPEVSVIIPTLNEALTIVAAIDSAFSAGAIEVIVSDGGSHDDTLRLASRHACRLVTGPSGRGNQQNLGAAEATGDVLLFLHADCCLPRDAIDQIRFALQDERLVGGAFRQRIDATEMPYRWLEVGNALRMTWLGLPYGDQALFVRRDVFERCGGFPNQPLMEDVTFARRLRRVGPRRLLVGPVKVSARRWRRHGIIRQTLLNWSLLIAYCAGVSPVTLDRIYRRRPPTPSVD